MIVDMAALTSVPVNALPYERFAEVLDPDRFAGFRAAADEGRRLLEGRVVWNVNSTARGGGVAEMLGKKGEAREWYQEGVLRARAKGDDHAVSEIQQALAALSA